MRAFQLTRKPQLLVRAAMSRGTTLNRDQAIRAQAVVELALALPILMMIIVGLFEFGRMIFVYSMVTSASREAARYGTGVGANAEGTPYYLDCEGIRESALTFGKWGGVEEDEVWISYDEGPDSVGPFPSCPVAAEDIELGDRIVVEVLGEFQPIPQMPFFDFPNWTFSSVSSRTLVKDLYVAQAGTAVVDFLTTTPTPTATLETTPTPTLTVTPTITETTSMATPTQTLTPTVTPVPPSAPIYPAVTSEKQGGKCEDIVFHWYASPDWYTYPQVWPETYQIFENGIHQDTVPSSTYEWASDTDLHHYDTVTFRVLGIFQGPYASQPLEASYRCVHGNLEPLE